MKNQRNKKRLVVLIPAFNESATIGDVVQSLPNEIDGIDEIIPVVIDDGSTDGTSHCAREAGAMVVTHPYNQGLANTFRSAIKTALEIGADLAVSIDADMQFSPKEIPLLVKPILEGTADFVAGNRFGDRRAPKHMDRLKYSGNRMMTTLINRLTGQSFQDVSSGFRAYSREALLTLNVQSSFTYTQETFLELAAKGISISQVPVTVRYYPERRSRLVTSVFRYGIRTFLTIARTTRDYAPLTIFGIASLPLVAIGIGIAIFVLAHYFASGSFSPYIFLAFTAVYLFTAGTGLFVLGLVADMLRGIRNNQERLLYFAKQTHYSDRSSDVHHAHESPDSHH